MNQYIRNLSNIKLISIIKLLVVSPIHRTHTLHVCKGLRMRDISIFSGIDTVSYQAADIKWSNSGATPTY